MIPSVHWITFLFSGRWTHHLCWWTFKAAMLSPTCISWLPMKSPLRESTTRKVEEWPPQTPFCPVLTNHSWIMQTEVLVQARSAVLTYRPKKIVSSVVGTLQFKLHCLQDIPKKSDENHKWERALWASFLKPSTPTIIPISQVGLSIDLMVFGLSSTDAFQTWFFNGLSRVDFIDCLSWTLFWVPLTKVSFFSLFF